MSFRTTIVLALILLGLVGYVWYFQPSQEEDSDDEMQRVLDLSQAEISAIGIESEHGSVVIDRSGDQWVLGPELPAPADQQRVDELLAKLSPLTAKQVIEDEVQDWSQYGLETPKTVVSVWTTAAASTTTGLEGAAAGAGSADRGAPTAVLEIGDQNFDATARFARADRQAKLLLLPSYDASTFEQSREQLRARKVLLFEPAQIDSIRIDSGLTSYALSRCGSRCWQIEEPRQIPADRATVDEWLTELTEMEADEFIDRPNDLAEFGLDEPRLVLSLADADGGAQWRLDVGSSLNEEHTYAKNPSFSTVYRVPRHFEETAFGGITALRKRKLAAFQKYDFSTLVVKRTDQPPVRLVKRDHRNWDVVQPQEMAADPETIGRLIEALSSLEAVGFPDDAPADLDRYGLAPPAWQIKMENGEGMRETLLLGSQLDDGRYAKVETEQPVYLVLETIVQQLSADPDFYRDHRLTSVQAYKLASIEIRTPEQELLVEQESPGVWSIRRPAERDLDMDRAIALASAVTGMRASRFIDAPPGQTTGYGLDQPAYTVVLRVSEEEESHEIRLGNETPSGTGRYSMIGERIVEVDNEQIAEFKKAVAGLLGKESGSD